MNDEIEFRFIATTLIDEKIADRALIMGVKQDWFGNRNMQILWDGIVKRRCMDEICNLPWASNYLKEKTKQELNGQFMRIYSDVLSPSREMNSTYEILHKNHIRRQLQMSISDIQRGLFGEHPLHLIDKLLKDLTALKSIHEDRTQPDIEEEILRRISTGIKIKMGFPRLDWAFKGIDPALRIIAGFSQHGKTTLALNIARNVAEQGNKVVIFSGETNNVLLVEKLAIMESGINTRYHLNEEEKVEFMKAVKKAKNLPISLMEASTLPQIRMEIQKRRAPLYIIDYLQIIDSGEKQASREREIEMTITELARLKREYDICIIALSAFNRSEYGEEPSMKSLRGSGSLEYAADQVVLLWYGYQSKQSADRRTAEKEGKDKQIEAYIAKDKIYGNDGQTILLEFDKKSLRMNEVEDEVV